MVIGWHAYRYLCILLGYFRDVFQIDISDKDSHSANIKPKGGDHILNDHCISTCKHVKF